MIKILTNFFKLKKFLILFFATSRPLFFLGSAILIASAICILLYPGTFSADSFAQLKQAEENSYRTWHPVIMAITMHYLLPLVGGLFVLHQFIYWISLALIIDSLFRRKIFYLLIGFFPPIFLLTIEIWKDSGMLVSGMLSFACLLQFQKNKKYKYIVIGIISILYASCVRSNAIIATSLLIGSAFVIYFGAKSCLLKKSIIFLSGALSIVVLTIMTNAFLEKAYNAKENNLLPALLLWDIAGICHFSGKTFEIPEYIEIIDKEKSIKWHERYVSYSNSICWGSGISCNLNEKNKTLTIIKDWFNFIKEEPLAYLQHRIRYTKVLFSIQKSVYYPYQGYSENRQQGSSFFPSLLGSKFFSLLQKAAKFTQDLFLYHAITWIIVLIVILIFKIKKFLGGAIYSFKDKISVMLCLSGLANAFSLTIIGPAADYRYMIWTVFSGVMCLGILSSTKELP